MKTLGAFLLLTIIGLICGVTITALDIAFEPKYCGEDCSNTALASLFTWLPICLVLFPSIGLSLWILKGRRTGKSLLVVCLALTLLALVPATGVYFYRASLHTTE